MTWTRKRKKYSKPRKLYDKIRIEEENELIKKYGLKKKKEIWKADAATERLRGKAKRLITASEESKQKLFSKLNKSGLKVKTISDVLGLKKEDLLRRRLQSILIQKNLANPKEARQLIIHKHVSINGNIVNRPGYIVDINEEDKIRVFKKLKKEKEK